MNNSVAPLDMLCDLYREVGFPEWADAIETSIDNGQPINYSTLPNVNQMTSRLLEQLLPITGTITFDKEVEMLENTL